MPRYFFHYHDHIIARDEEGVELADVAAARDHALLNARSVMAEDIISGQVCLGHRIDVEDEQGQPVFTLKFAEAVTITE